MIQPGIILIGASGHAKVIIDIFRSMGEQVDYCIGNAGSHKTCLNVTVLNGDERLVHLRKQGYSKAFIAIGANAVRQRMANVVLQMGYHLVNAISPHAKISPSAQLDVGIAVMPGAIINADAVIEKLVIINTGATIDHDCHIKNGAHIAPQCGLAGNVTVGELSFLGVGCKVIPEIQIGKETTIGAGSVVVKNIPDKVTALGVPAQVVKTNP